MKINWNFLWGGGLQSKKPSVGGVWKFSGTANLVWADWFEAFIVSMDNALAHSVSLVTRLYHKLCWVWPGKVRRAEEG